LVKGASGERRRTEVPKVEFKNTVELHGKTATGIEVPAEAVEALGGGKKPAVVVAINGASYRTTVAPRGGRFLIPVSAENRAVVGVEAGDQVTVGLSLDTEERSVEVPADLAAALRADPGAGDFFAGLTPSQRKEYVRWVESAKKDETRVARVQRSVALLREGKKSH
jgi:hypothetical protein